MKALKITLLIMAGLALLLGGSGYGCYRWVTSTMHTLEEQEPAVKEEALRYAETHDVRACAFEAVARGKKCWGTTCQILTGRFLDTCLASAAPNPALCDGTPKVPSVEAATWPLTTCVRLGAPGDTACQLVTQRVMEYCSSTRR